MRRGYVDMLARSIARLRHSATREAATKRVRSFCVTSPPLADFDGGRTRAVTVSFGTALPIGSGVVTLESDGGRVVPMLFDQPRLYQDGKRTPQWDVYVKAYRATGTALELYDADDALVATIQVMQPASARHATGAA